VKRKLIRELIQIERIDFIKAGGSPTKIIGDAHVTGMIESIRNVWYEFKSVGNVYYGWQVQYHMKIDYVRFGFWDA